MTHYVHPAHAGLFIPDTLLDALEAGIVQFRPVYAADDPAALLDLSYVSINLVAQQLLGLNGLPPLPFCALASHDTALFEFWRDTFWSGEVGYYEPGYVAAGARWRVAAQRAGELLVVSFSKLTGPGAGQLISGALARAEQATQLADQQLMQEREVFRQVFAQTPAAICILRGPEYRFEYVNKAFGQLFLGRVLEGQPAAVIMPEVVHQGIIKLLDRVYETGETFFGTEVPITIAQPNGQPTKDYYFNFTYQAHLENGHAERLSVFAYDVTEQVLARRDREAHRAEWQRVFEDAPVAIAVLRGPRYLVELANPAAYDLWDRNPVQVLNRPLFEVLPEAAGRGLEELLDKVLATGEPYIAKALPTYIDRYGRLDTVYWNFVYQPLYEAHDRSIVGVVVVATEVSEQINARHQVQELNEELNAANTELHANNDELALAQRQLQQLNQDLEARVAAGVQEARQAWAEAEHQRQRLERLFEQSPAAISILGGPDLVYELVNPGYQHFFPGQPQLGLSLKEAKLELLNQQIPVLLREVYATGIAHEGHEVLLQVPRPDGGPPEGRYFNCLYQARYDEHGEVDGVLVFALDVTEQVHARQQMQQFNQALEARVAERTQEAEAARAEAETQRLLLHTIIQQAPVAITYIEGPELRVSAINPAACHVLGCKSEELLNRPLLETLPHLQKFGELLHEVMRTQMPFWGQEAEATMQREGELATTYFNLAYQPLVNEQGLTTGVLSVAIEVTEQVRARQQMQHLNEELETRVAAGLAEAHYARTQAERRQERLERFFAQVPAAVCILDGPELVFELANASFQSLFPGRPLLGLPVLEALPEFGNLPVYQQMQRVYATGETHEETNQVIALAQYASGPLTDFHFHYVQQARYNAQGRIDGVLVFALDLTAQVRVQRRAETLQEEALAAVQRRAREHESFYQIFAQTPAVIALVRGPEYHFDHVNKAFEQLFPGRELRGLPVLAALPEIGSQGFVALLDQVYQTGETFVGTEMPLVITQPDGQAGVARYMNFTYQAYRENGVIVGVSVFAYDVTEQVLARQQREVGLAQLQTVFERAPVALALLTGPTYLIEVANPAICAFWGRERAEIMGRPLFEVLPEVVSQGFPELLAEVWRTGEPFVTEERPVELLRQGHRDTVYFQFVYQPLADAQGLVTAVVIVATDLSTRVLNRQQLAQANAELQATNTQLTHTNTDLDNFIYTASHDLKAPIANIESLLLLLRKQLPTEARQAGLVPRVLTMMQEAVERFQLTIAQLTDLSRLQLTRAELAETVDLATIVEAVRLDLAPMLEATGAQLVVDVAACATVQFAPRHLRSVVYNLLGNAIKYHHPDRPPLVQLRCRPSGTATVLEVQDNGLGLSPEQQTKLFGLFQRLHAHVEGSGVGLYMVKRIVENVGGTITVASQPGVGSTFTVTFPAAAPLLPA